VCLFDLLKLIQDDELYVVVALLEHHNDTNQPMINFSLVNPISSLCSLSLSLSLSLMLIDPSMSLDLHTEQRSWIKVDAAALMAVGVARSA
jgi:hypothetical protein